jgi:tRNA-uridine 2-sulfurtransferase
LLLNMNAPPDKRNDRHHPAYGPRVQERLAAMRMSLPPTTLVDPTGEGQAGSRECGSLIAIQVKLEGDVVQVASFRAYGCPATLASAGEAVRQTEGRTLLEAAMVGEATIIEALQLPPDKWSKAATATDALHTALGQALLRTAREKHGSSAGDATHDSRCDPKGVLVGMSGGVDSTVAALLLREHRYRPIGATLKLWTDPGSGGENSCCSGDAVQRARRVAHKLGIPHFTLDAGEAFFASVVQYFLTEYAEGRTPNPCAKCNARLRFGLLAEAATRLGLDKIATGHYARLTGDPPRLSRGLCGPKDQSYVLAEIAPDLLERTLFPLGGQGKSAVRDLARDAGLEGYDAPESQDICFVPEAGHRPFLRRRLGARPGSIVDDTGRTVGRHTGTYNFTIGQRRGHGVAAGEPLFVTHIDAERAEVVLGPRDQLAVGEIVLEHITVHRPGAPAGGLVQTRSSGPPWPGVVAEPAPAASECHDSSKPNQVHIRFDTPAFGIAPGQTAVFYDGDDVVLAGTVAETIAGTVTEAPGRTQDPEARRLSVERDGAL